MFAAMTNADVPNCYMKLNIEVIETQWQQNAEYMNKVL